MSLIVTGWTLAIVLAGASQTLASRCSPAVQAVLEQAAAEAARGEYAAAAERVRTGDDRADACRFLRLAAWASRGWVAAAAAADRGGAPGALAPVVEAVEMLTAIGAIGSPRSEAAYAVALLKAASAAAQDERDEMLVWIEEARAVAARLALAGPAPLWPLPVDLAEGELWHGVDDYELAEAAFTRALATRESPLAWRGLARAQDRRANRSGACQAYRRVQQALAAESAPGPLAVEARAYLLLCTP